MTKVLIQRRNKSIVSVKCDGHAGYGAKGEDIVCAALSSVVQTALLGLMSVVGVNVDFKRNDEKGMLEFSLPEDLGGETRKKADIVLDTMLCGVADLYEGYSDFIDLEVV